MRHPSLIYGNLRIPGTPHTHVYGETPTGAIDGVNKDFTLSRTPKTGTVRVFNRAGRWDPNTDYTVVVATITFTDAPLVDDIILVDYDY